MKKEVEKKNNKKLDAAKKAIGNIQKKFGDGSIMMMKDAKSMDVETIPTGCFSLDLALGGGFPRGRIVEAFGKEASGKTTLSLHTIAEAQKDGGIVAFVDAEHCISGDEFIYLPEENRYEKVEELCDEEVTLQSFDKKGNPINRKGIVAYNGIEDVIEIKTRYQQRIKLTKNHTVLTKSGWKKVSELNTDDILFMPKQLENSCETLDNEDFYKYKLLGYHISDGSIGRTDIASDDNAVIEDLNEIADFFDCRITRCGCNNKFVKKDSYDKYEIPNQMIIDLINKGFSKKEMLYYFGGLDYEIINKRLSKIEYDKKKLRDNSESLRSNKRPMIKEISDINYCSPKNKAWYILDEFECFHKHSKDRRLPILKDSELKVVLGAMITSDGTIVDYDRQHKISGNYSTSSRHLAYDVSSAMLKFGIMTKIDANIKTTEDKTYDVNYRVIFSGFETFKKLLDFPIIGYKRDRIIKTIKNCKFKNDTSRTVYYNEYIELPIVSLTSIGKVDTYNVSMPNYKYDEQIFLCNNIVVHNSLDPKYAKKIGVNIDNMLISQPDSGEEALQIVEELVLSGGIDVIVVDSVAALVPRKEIEGEIGDAHVALQARLMSQALRKLAPIVSKTNTVIIFINQLRQKIGVFFGKNTVTPGGMALKFYSSVRVEMVRAAQIKKSDEIVGNRVIAKVVKNKVAPPFKTCQFDIMYDEGISLSGDLIDIGMKYKIVKKSGNSYFFGEEKLGVGREKVKEELISNNKIAKEIKDSIKLKIKEAKDLIK